MQPVTSTISRDASAQAKGPRLQRLRACALLIDALANEDAVQVYSCLEALGDVCHSTADANGTSTYSEEDKNYDVLTTFTLLSPEILNSLVIFADMWINARYSERLRFGFYTPASIGKEQANGERIKRLGLSVPAAPCLQLLSAPGPYDQALVHLVKALVTDEYAAQYAKRPGHGFLAEVELWSDDSWRTLLGRIEWQFGASDHQALTAETLAKIRGCKLFGTNHVGKDQIILAALMDRLDEVQGAADHLQRFVHRSDVELIFRDVAAGVLCLDDPTWQMWEQIKANDCRNIEQKVLEACPSAPRSLLGDLARKAAASMYEQKALEHDRRLLALKYQIYDECSDALSLHASGELDADAFRALLDSLYQRAIDRVRSCCQTYNYPLAHDPAVRGMVVELIDSCFLCFVQGDE
jgi:hypothetical protein